MIIEESDDDNWSILPTLLLWMIKSRLDYPNGIRFASVCKNWRDASVSYPTHFKDEFEVNNSPPWIMSYTENSTESRREFVNLLTEERYTIDNPGFIGSEVLYSRQGWLLLQRPKERLSYLLLNPFKNTNIKLPSLNVTIHLGAFNIEDDNPHCVIVVGGDNSEYNIVLYMVHPGDSAWFRYSYRYKIDVLDYFEVRYIVIVGKLVYCISENAYVFVFSIANTQWKEYLLREPKELSYLSILDEQYMVERQGEILRFHLPRGVTNKNKDPRKANCYKMKIDGENVNWESIDGGLLSGTCFWFLTQSYGNSFASEIKNTSELNALQKAFRNRLNRAKKQQIRTLAFRRKSNSNWVHMG